MDDLPSGYVKIAIENDHAYWIFPLEMVIDQSVVESNPFHGFWFLLI